MKSAEDKYVKARVSGSSGKEARDIAGYSKNSGIKDLEGVGTPIYNKLQIALEKKNINADFLADEYIDGIKLSKTTKHTQCNAHVKYLSQLGELLGYGKKEAPTIAIQQNFGAPTPEDSGPVLDDPGSIEELISRNMELLKAVEREVGLRINADVHATESKVIDSEACPGVDMPSDDGRQTDNRGES